jgi:hypothetical protein
MRWTLGLALVAVFIAVGAVVAAATPSDGGSPTAPPPDKPGRIGPVTFVRTGSSPPPISGGAALHRVVASLKRAQPVVGRKRSDLVSARIGRQPHWVRLADPKHAAAPALYVTERFPGSKNGGDIESTWEQNCSSGLLPS